MAGSKGQRKSARPRGSAGRRRREFDHDRILAANGDSIVLVDAGALRPSPENDDLYAPPDPKDPEFIRLVESIRRDGIREPLVVTIDGYVISGHRRLAASGAAGLRAVPCRIADYRREDDKERFLRDLREFNRQRVKSRSERLREIAVDLSAEDAHLQLIEYRRAQSKVKVDSLELGSAKRRPRISDAKRPLLDAAKNVITERRKFWPLSVRGIHYALLNNPPLTHAAKPDSWYGNDDRSYRALVDLLTRARFEGAIPFEAIHDPTRPVTRRMVSPDVGGYVHGELDSLFLSYCRDLMQSQPNTIELVCEKNTVQPILRQVAADFTIPLTSGRGYGSVPPRRDMYKRFRRSGKDKLVIVFVTDLDPEGEDIATSFARSLRDDFGIVEIHPIKAALTMEQVREFNLPAAMKAKQGSSRRAGFVEKHGEHVWELEALPPATLQDIVRGCIESVLDMDAFESEVEAEREDACFLETRRQMIFEALAEIPGDN
jgi:hypothetical protein